MITAADMYTTTPILQPGDLLLHYSTVTDECEGDQAHLLHHVATEATLGLLLEGRHLQGTTQGDMLSEDDLGPSEKVAPCIRR